MRTKEQRRRTDWGAWTAAVMAIWVVGGQAAWAGEEPATVTNANEKTERAVFAGGCFWCMQPAFERLPGVVSTAVGYTGGTVPDPTYEQVCRGDTGHVEALEIVFDPARVTFEQLLEVYWRSVDPTDAGGQFADRGEQYRPVIFFTSENQRQAAERSRAALAQSGRFNRPIAVAIEPVQPFFPAEAYHQFYYQKNPEPYVRYKTGSGRAGFLDTVWKDKAKP